MHRLLAAGADPECEIGEKHEPETHLIPLVINAALDNRKIIRVFGDDYNTPDGSCIRDYIHVEDLATAHVLSLNYILNSKKSEVFNLGNGLGYSVYEIIRTTEKLAGVKINSSIDKRRPGDPDKLVANAQKIKNKLGWSPKLNTIEQIIDTALAWHKKIKKRRYHESCCNWSWYIWSVLLQAISRKQRGRKNYGI